MFKKLLKSKKAQIISIMVSIIIIIGCLSAIIIPMLINSNDFSGIYKSNLIIAASSVEINNDEQSKDEEIESEELVEHNEAQFNLDEISSYLGYWYCSPYPNDAELAITSNGSINIRICMPGVDFASGNVNITDRINEITLTSAVTGRSVRATLSFYDNFTIGFDFYDADFGYEVGLFTFDTVYPATNWRDHGPFDTNYTPEITDGNASIDRGDIICVDCGTVVDSSLYDTNHYRAGRCASCFDAMINAGKPQEYAKYCNGCGAEIITYDPNDVYYSSGYCSNCYFACNSCGTVIGNPDYSQECYQYGMCQSCYDNFLANQPAPNVFCPVCGWGLYATSVGYDGFICGECGTHFLHNGTILED